jgi:SulP family sulfate permease
MLVIEKQPRVRIIRMRNVPAIDATGLQALRDFHKDAEKYKTHLILSGVHTQPLFAMTQAGIIELYKEENILGNIDDALDRAREILGLPKLGRPKDFIPTVKRETE